jgi:hypothetical protein
MDTLQQLELSKITLIQHGEPTPLHFESAYLFIHTEPFSMSWFVDLTKVENTELMERLQKSNDIHIVLQAVSVHGHSLVGEGYIYPSLKDNNAAIRGNGELLGYEGIEAT